MGVLVVLAAGANVAPAAAAGMDGKDEERLLLLPVVGEGPVWPVVRFILVLLVVVVRQGDDGRKEGGGVASWGKQAGRAAPKHARRTSLAGCLPLCRGWVGWVGG